MFDSTNLKSGYTHGQQQPKDFAKWIPCSGFGYNLTFKDVNILVFDRLFIRISKQEYFLNMDLKASARSVSDIKAHKRISDKI